MKLYENGLEEYPISQALISNFLILLWIGIGAYSAYLLLPLLGYIYALLFLFLIYFLLRKLVCVDCFYYGRICSMGWGKLSSFLFSRGEIERFPSSFGIKIAPFVYGSLTVLPIIFLIVTMAIRGFSADELILLLLIILVGLYSGTISRKRTCSRCKMRYICPGSAAKGTVELQ